MENKDGAGNTENSPEVPNENTAPTAEEKLADAEQKLADANLKIQEMEQQAELQNKETEQVETAPTAPTADEGNIETLTRTVEELKRDKEIAEFFADKEVHSDLRAQTTELVKEKGLSPEDAYYQAVGINSVNPEEPRGVPTAPPSVSDGVFDTETMDISDQRYRQAAEADFNSTTPLQQANQDAPDLRF